MNCASHLQKSPNPYALRVGLLGYLRIFIPFCSRLCQWFTLLGGAVFAVGLTSCRSFDLVASAERGNFRAVKAHLTRGVDPNRRGMHAMTPLMGAAKGGHIEMCELLIRAGADVNGHNESGSALMWAVDSGREGLVRLLLNAAADPAWKNHLGDTAEFLARQQRKNSIASLLTK